jgi:CHASE3 domain sensor protein
MQRIRNLRVGMKIGLGFALITLVLMGVVLITIQHVKSMENLSKRLVHLRTPTAHASLMMLNGINHSLASLRGWIILGENKFKEEREQAWMEQIQPSLDTMKKLSTEWTDLKNVENLKFIENKLAKFKQYQEEIENIAQTEENTPAKKILFAEAEPLEEIIMRNISKTIQLELKMAGSSDRRELLGLMADVEGQTNLSMEKTEEFLLSGDDRFKKAFEESWGLNKQRFSKMKQHSKLFLPEQKVAINKIDRAMQKLGPLLKKIVRIRSQDGWNLANTLLGDKAAPIAFQIKEKLNEMSDNHSHLLQADMEAISNQTHRLIILLVLLFFAGALLSGVLGAAITNSVSRPIQNVSRMAREIAEGNLRQKKLPVVSNDELCELSQSLNQLLDQLKKVQSLSKPSPK